MLPSNQHKGLRNRAMAVKHARETVEAAIASSCAMMGVEELKEKQKNAIKLFVEGINDVDLLVILPSPVVFVRCPSTTGV